MVYNKTQTDRNMLSNEKKKILSENETTERTRKGW